MDLLRLICPPIQVCYPKVRTFLFCSETPLTERSILTAIVLDAFSSTFEVKKLVKAGHQTAIQLRITQLQDLLFVQWQLLHQPCVYNPIAAPRKIKMRRKRISSLRSRQEYSGNGMPRQLWRRPPFSKTFSGYFFFYPSQKLTSFHRKSLTCSLKKIWTMLHPVKRKSAAEVHLSCSKQLPVAVLEYHRMNCAMVAFCWNFHNSSAPYRFYG